MPLLIMRSIWIKLKALKVTLEGEGKLVYKLNKSLYGLKQSCRNWNHVLHCFLLENDFVQSPVDNCVYIKQDDSGLVTLLCLSR